MQILCSNFPPVKTQNATFADTFYEFLPKADCLNIAVGYVTADSLIELQKAVELNHVHQLNLIIGMHYIDQFTPVEYRTAVKLNEFLHTNAIGEVRLVTPFRYHGKIYTFYRSGKPFASIIAIFTHTALAWRLESCHVLPSSFLHFLTSFVNRNFARQIQTGYA